MDDENISNGANFVNFLLLYVMFRRAAFTNNTYPGKDS